ncbi:ATP-binding cassette domain-containing protein [Ferrimonas lipolytica]|uniref:ATP-binding cassette domain-containing protein n=1 Tax=Ferrimonas lipolytica TaxID=2724191 RepID=A0A6H1UC80_9GAMM|nr:ATP-binding cassette domain-containing protein [Ferrimonas lipolytica]QIZ75973.1 ATP-binding cassette domain-containing protein [Ferrimonas lipolytica]
MANDAPVALRLHQVSVTRGQQTILKEVSLRIPEGQAVAIIGPSGAGKSTLLEQLRLHHAEQVSWCPQAPGLVPMLNLYNNVYMGRLHQRTTLANIANLICPKRQDVEEIAVLATSLGLLNGDPKRLYQSAERFSGGEQQRISLARALYQQRSIFIGDEPVSAIDELHAITVLQQIKAAHRTMVVALHDVELALGCCERIIALNNGRIVLDQLSSEISRNQLLALYPHEQY